MAAADPLQPPHGLTVDVGGGVVTRPKYLGSSDYTQIFAPVLDGRLGRDIRFSLDDGISWAPVHLGVFSFGPVVEFRQSYNSVRLARGPRSPSDFEAGGTVKAETKFGDFEARLRHGFNDETPTSADITYDALFPIHPKTYLAVEARTSWANEAYTLPAPRRGGVPLPLDRDYYSAGAQSTLIYEFNSRYRAILLASYDRLIIPNTRALSLGTHDVFNIGVVVTRRFQWDHFYGW